MTTTPESWDDVGCLRLKVNCISQAVENVQKGQQEQAFSHGQNLSAVSQLQAATQELKAELALLHAQNQVEKKEACRTKVGVIIALILISCVLALQAFMIYTGAVTGLTQRNTMNHPKEPHTPQSQILNHEAEGLSNDAWKTNRDDHKASEVTAPMPANEDKQRKMRNDLQLKQNSVINGAAVQPQYLEGQTIDKRKQQLGSVWMDPQMVATETKKKASTSWNGAEKRVPETTHPSELEELQSSIDSEGRADLGSESAHEDARQDAKDVEDKDSKEREDLEEIKQVKGDLSQPLPFQIMNPDNAEELMSLSQNGLFWVCFPPTALEKSVKAYASAFNEVARSQKWRIYSFCYLDTNRLKQDYTDHFCHDIRQITFVLEKNSAANSGSKHTPFSKNAESDFEEFHRDTGSPAWFKRTFPPDQDIHASLIEQFLNDVHSGKIPEIINHIDL
eukprot:gnl/MRDRNA2_/MRDRNA2_81491_c0_seq2.p1 gnl/MRDRNA2_/MRDRNA2_81491_c0~~gnl/MRDRNA2_/MRDRNA2_81491_c0_seq2.p1  ORF type:complete len:449 (-),score=92.48 gnl/MRDRNA2_/MRDRNA2_81491_c0_seq2:206-1552(-)